jgi:hypothetical protein
MGASRIVFPKIEKVSLGQEFSFVFVNSQLGVLIELP